MKPEDRSKLQSYISEISGLKAREPEEKKLKDWKENVEKKLEEVFGKGSGECEGFKRIRFPVFRKDASLNENERGECFSRLDDARRYLQRFV